ncbi:MAG: 1-(5-phosphoribosyl)-5-[(5-phosphoribosylamino)methylideneamino] imidazole-4-carboxamide isomerase [Myxococcaceae bacterium]
MRAIPAVDLRQGACVQLVGGRPEDERIRVSDPVVAATRWRDAGFTSLHVVDLDAALGGAPQDDTIGRVVKEGGLPCSVGGGVRDVARIERLFELGAERVVVGTRGIADPAFLADACARWPERIVLAADVRGREVQVRGWTEGTGMTLAVLLERVQALALGGVLVTAVHVEGLMTGPDVSLVREARSQTRVPLIASGGVGSMEDLKRLEDAGADAAVLGMSLYTGAIDPERVAKEFSR